jgi:hypothetical protein
MGRFGPTTDRSPLGSLGADLRRVQMKRTAIALILLALMACEEGSPTVSERPPTDSPSVDTPTATSSATPSRSPEAVERSQFLELPEVGRVKVTNSCQFDGPDGPVFRADLGTGGALQLRRTEDSEVLLVSALPSPDADPVSTRGPSDTSYTEDGGYLTGTSRLWLDDTDNRIDVRFRVLWDDSIPSCQT